MLEGCKNSIGRKSSRIGVVRVSLPQPLELGAAPRLSFISPQMNLYLQLLVMMLAGWINRHQQSVIEYLQAGNRALREQLGPKRIRWTEAQRLLLATKAKAIGRGALKQLGTIVTPDTLLRWYRKLVAAKYDGSAKRGPGRPRTDKSVTELIVEMAQSNPGWGYARIRGALHNLGHDVARNTIKNTLLANGLEPAPERGKRTSWRTFIQSHLGASAGADFFTVEVLTPFGLGCVRSASSRPRSADWRSRRCARDGFRCQERNHQGLGNELIEQLAANTNGREGTVRRRGRLGGVLSYYYRDAA